MKIGILTFIHTHNFGANLQCFALQHQLESMGFDVDILNLYRPVDKGYVSCDSDKTRFPILYKFNTIIDYRSRFNKFFAHVLWKFRPKRISSTADGFIEFQNNYIHFSDEEYRNFTQLYDRFPQAKYTHLIVGSDQVWNYSSNFSKEPFFLTFAKKTHKISYAPSIGHSNIPNMIGDIYKKWLDDFSAISVREESASDFLSKLLDRPIPQVLDPTLLLNKECWLKALSIPQKDNENYVLVYMLSLSVSAIDLAKRIANKLGCSVKIITNRPVVGNLDNCELLRTENPRSFVERYSKARFVITNSFHGTAFAVNFNIPFITVEKMKSRLNSRKTSLLNLLELKQRQIFEDDNMNMEDFLDCDFSKANEILERERKKSFEYLIDSLNK